LRTRPIAVVDRSLHLIGQVEHGSDERAHRLKPSPPAQYRPSRA
jgi:hypothetical protein